MSYKRMREFLDIITIDFGLQINFRLSINMFKLVVALLVLATVCSGQKSVTTYLSPPLQYARPLTTYIERPITTYVNRPLEVAKSAGSYVNVQGPTVQYVQPGHVQYLRSEPFPTKSIQYAQRW